MPSALITGISGQDGFYLSNALVAAGYEVHGIARNAPADSTIVNLHSVDLLDSPALDSLVMHIRPDEIFNLAAISSVHRSWSEPLETMRVNVLPLAQLLDSAWKLHERGKEVRVVQASSAEVFGHSAESPQTERTSVNPSSPYGAAKASADHLVRVYRERGLFASSCILYNHESPRRSETFVTRKITAGVARIATGSQTHIRLGKLDVHRDWGWAPDYARALSLAARADSPDDFVIATGITHSISDFVTAAFARVGITDWSDLVVIDPEFSRPVDPFAQVGDASRARTVLGWRNTVDFVDIVNAMVDHDMDLVLAG